MPSQATRTRETVDLSELGFDADADVERERLDHRWLYSAVDENLPAPGLSQINLSKHAV